MYGEYKFKVKVKVKVMLFILKKYSFRSKISEQKLFGTRFKEIWFY